MPNLDFGVPVTVSYSGAAVSYTATDNGLLSFELWGGGGGGASCPSGVVTGNGGCGGNTYGAIAITTGDVIKLEIANGGEKGAQASNGGSGGWPDGGQGGLSNGAAAGCAGGAGGGSTRMYLNNVLIAIAGGGGGGSGRQPGGTGGGTAGTAGGGSPTVGGGGTQTAGGAGGGASMSGGNGWAATGQFTAQMLSGGGGGGGYFGGGGGRGATNGTFPGGGGGSGYSNNTYVSASMSNGSGSTSNNSGHKPTNAGNGGTSALTNAAASNGFAGAAYLSLATAGTSLPNTLTQLNYTGAQVNYSAPSAGYVFVQMWGGGGGGGANASVAAASNGGGGGYIYAEIPLAAGQTVTFVVGQGGRGSATTLGGAAAYPNGGYGGSYPTTGYSGGSGGGSSMVRVDGVIFAVAGAGGGGRGSGYPASNTAQYQTQHGGGGGGTTGGNGYQASTNVRGQGGTQSSGGSGPQVSGSFLQGGNGDTLAYGVTTGNVKGGGGGGGYYGGGGGANNTVTTGGGGGGGSGYLKSGAGINNGVNSQGTTSGTATATAAGNTEANYVSGRGQGGSGATSGTASNGGDGLIFFTFYPGLPGNADGDLATITMSPGAATPSASASFDTGAVMPGPVVLSVPVGTGSVPATPPGLIGTIALTVPAGTGGTAANVSKPFPGPITNNGDELGGQGFADVFLVVPLVDYDLIPTPPVGLAGVPIIVTRPLPGPITFTPPVGSIIGAAEGLLGTIVVSNPEATAYVSISGLIPSITLATPDGTGSGNASASPVDGQTPFTLTAVTPTGTAFMYHAGDIGTINLVPFEGNGNTGQYYVPFMTIEGPDGYTEIGPIETNFGSPITLSALDAEGQGSVEMSEDLPVITMYTVDGSSGRADTSGDIGTIYITAGEGSGHAEPGSAYVSGDLAVISLSTPNGIGYEYDGSGFAFGELQTIRLTQIDGSADDFDPNGYAEGDVGSISLTVPTGEFTYFGEGAPLDPILLTAPEGEGHGGYRVIGDFGAAISLAVPDSIPTGSVEYNVDEQLNIKLEPIKGAPVKSVTLLVSIFPAIVNMKPFGAVAGPVDSIAVDGDLASMPITLTQVEGYGENMVPGWAPFLFKRTSTAGKYPTSLAPREIAFGESDGWLYSRDGAGAVKATPLVAIQNGAEVPTTGTTGTYLRGDGQWSAGFVTYTKPLRLAPPKQVIVLSEGVLGDTNAVMAANTIYYRPFFVPKTVKLSGLTVNSMSASAAVAHVGICQWTLPQTPVMTIFSGDILLSSTGDLTLTGEVTLTPGWYAAMIAVTGGTPTLGGSQAPMQLLFDFSLGGDPTGTYTSFSTLGSPNGRAANSIAFIKATAENV